SSDLEGGVHTLAFSYELLEGPFLAGQLSDGSSSSLFLGEPSIEFGFFYRIYYYRHEAVQLAAELGALTTIYAGDFNVYPGFVDKARNCVFFNGKFRYPPGVDYVCRGEQEAHFGVGWDHQRFVHFQQVVFAFLYEVINLLVRRGQVAE